MPDVPRMDARLHRVYDARMERVALVTGGAKRVGRAVAEHLARLGYRVVVTFNRTQVEPPVDRTLNGRLIPIGPIDFADPVSISRLRDAFCQRFDRLDLLVNNASLYLPDSDPQAHLQMQVNFHAPVALVGSMRSMLAEDSLVVNMLDVLAERPRRGWQSYCASKAALWSATRGMALELAPRTRVCGIAPGVVDWPPETSESEKLRYLKSVPLGRAGTPSDVARCVEFLASAGTYINGEVIRLDGGRHLKR